MTTLLPGVTVCGVCGSFIETVSLTSTTSFGAPDLDLRPPELARSTLPYWVSECGQCGYAARELGKASDEVKRLVRSEEYARVLESARSVSGKFRRFVLAAEIAERTGLLVEAAELSLWAAWAADDARATRAAVKARSRTLELMERVRSAGRRVFDEPDSDLLVAIDLLRRCGRFEEARDRCGRLRLRAREPHVAAIVTLQERLISERDAGCHTIAAVAEDTGD